VLYAAAVKVGCVGSIMRHACGCLCIQLLYGAVWNGLLATPSTMQGSGCLLCQGF
jgi:hypothetical protein